MAVIRTYRSPNKKQGGKARACRLRRWGASQVPGDFSGTSYNRVDNHDLREESTLPIWYHDLIWIRICVEQGHGGATLRCARVVAAGSGRGDASGS
jgi:hypothetical protein